jgi:LytS/YehU family sensor histidine kinase
MKSWRQAAPQALILTLAVWGANFLLFLVYAALAGAHHWGLTIAIELLLVISGLILSALLYLAVKMTQHLSLGPRVAALGLAVFALGVVQAGSDTAITQNLHYVAPQVMPMADARAYFGNMVGFYTDVFALYATALGLIEAAAATRRREVQLAAAQAAAHQAQLAALRFQLNPHFLFNTLNAISSLVVTGRNGAADEMVGKLSDFLRGSLAADPAEAIPLSDELSSVQTYLGIEAIRFGDRLAVEFACPPGLSDALVPGFLLQPLVENAVKYAVAPSRRRVTIRIEVVEGGGDLVLMVGDDGDAREQSAARAGTGVGLRNVRRRLEVLYGPRGVLEAAPRETGFLAIVRLPLTRRGALAAAA